MPSAMNWTMNSVSVRATDAPKQRNIAAASRWRRRYRDAASATATAASSTATSADKPRKRSARSSVCRTSGRRSRTDSTRCPGVVALASHVRKRSTSPGLRSATSNRHVARLPGCSRLVAGTSSRFSSSFGPGANVSPAISGSCAMIAVTVSVASPTATFEPLVNARRSASRVSTHASPRAGMPCASWRSAVPGSASAIAPRSG